MKTKRKILALWMVLALVLTLVPATVFAEGGDNGPAIGTSGCEAHTEHDGECGYKEAVPGAACEHDCADGDCGYIEAVPCDHQHDENCGEDGTDCAHACADGGCGYLEGVPCGHQHDDGCGYSEETPEQPCAHTCGECAPPPVMAANVEIGNPEDLTGSGLTGTEVYFGEYSGDPIKWHVVATGSGTATLWTTTNVAGSSGKRYDPSFHNDWSGSEICGWLNRAFLNDAFSGGEQNAITSYGATETTNEHNNIDIGQKIVLPSVEEMGSGINTGTWNINQGSRVLGDNWWLRSPGTHAGNAAFVHGGGYVHGDGHFVNYPYGLRPAFKLNLSSVLFTSSAALGGKSSVAVGDPLSAAEPPTGAVKLTVLDAYNAGTNETGQKIPDLTFAATTDNTGELRFGYTGATAGANQYVSCVLTTGSGASEIVKYYGKLADCETTGNGTLSIPLAGVDNGIYTLKIFSEQANADYLTDYASTPVTMKVTVNDEQGTASEFGGTVDNTAPTVQSVIPANSATGVATSGNLVITFNEAMNPAVNGSVTLTGGSSTVNPSGVWSNENKTYTIVYSGLEDGTAYTINISGFKDVAGNEMTALTSGYSFTTAAEPPPDAKSVTVTASPAAGGNPTATPASATPTQLVTLEANPNPGYTFDGWESADVTIASPTQLTATFTMPDSDVTVTASYTYTGTTPTPSDSSGRDSGSSARSWTPVFRKTEYIIDRAEMQKLIAAAEKNGRDFVRSSSDLPTTVQADAWKLLKNYKLVARTTAERAVQVQLTFPEPAKLTADMQVSGYTKGSIVNSRRALFQKWFSNKVRIIHLEHSGSFGQPVEVAAKVDLSNMDAENLYIYRYDKQANSYSLICRPNRNPAEYRIDKNGYLHFTTDRGGDFVVSEGALAGK